MLGSATRQDGDTQSPRRQITADSFRALSSRLSGLRKAPPAERPAAEDLPSAKLQEPAESVADREAAYFRTAPETQTVIEPDVFHPAPEPVETAHTQPVDEIVTEPPPFEAEILQDLVEATEIVSAEGELPAEPTSVEEILEDFTAAELNVEQPVAEAEILHELVEAAETVPVEDEIPAALDPIDGEALDASVEDIDVPPAAEVPVEEPVAEEEILHELFDAAQSAEMAEQPASTAEEPALDRVDWQIAEAVTAHEEPDIAPQLMPEATAPDEATAFAFAEADATPKADEVIRHVEIAAPPAVDEAPGELSPPDIAHIRTIISEGRHWPDEATIAPDTNSGEIARSLLDIMSMPQAGSLPQERALAADTLLRLIPRLPDKNILDLVERVSVMEAPSQLLVRRLINDPRIEVSAPLLERGTVVSDRDLIAVIEENDSAKQRLIARRRGISPALSEALILSGDDETITNLLRNGQASFSIEAFDRLLLLAVHKPDLRAPLATRPDLPAPVAFELFWCLPAELRRYVLSRFLTDSETINKILRLSQVTGTSAIAKPENSDLAILGEVIANRFMPEAAQLLAKLANISLASAEKIVADQGKEPLTVAMKAAGLSRSQFETLINRLLGKDDNDPLKRIFDQLSFNKARVLLTYWDWAANHTGPYAKAAA
jgi:hypothetical protein